MIDALFEEGKTVLFVGFGGRLLGILGPQDTLRPDPPGRGHRHRDRRRSLRHAPLPQRHHRARRHCDHSDPQERPTVEGGLPSRQGPQRTPVRHTLLRPGVLETVDGILRPQARRSQDALAGSLEAVALQWLDLKSFGERIAAVRPCRSDQ